MDDQQLGELIGTVRAIKENTDKIPDMATTLALHEVRISKLEPKVEDHEKMAQRSIGVSAIFGALAGIVTAMVGNIRIGS